MGVHKRGRFGAWFYREKKMRGIFEVVSKEKGREKQANKKGGNLGLRDTGSRYGLPWPHRTKKKRDQKTQDQPPVGGSPKRNQLKKTPLEKKKKNDYSRREMELERKKKEENGLY